MKTIIYTHGLILSMVSVVSTYAEGSVAPDNQETLVYELPEVVIECDASVVKCNAITTEVVMVESMGAEYCYFETGNVEIVTLQTVEYAVDEDPPISEPQDDAFESIDLVVYPNPMLNGSSIQIDITAGQFRGNPTINIFSSSGQLVHQQPWLPNSFTQAIQLEPLSRGIYHVTVDDGDQRWSERLVVR